MGIQYSGAITLPQGGFKVVKQVIVVPMSYAALLHFNGNTIEEGGITVSEVGGAAQFSTTSKYGSHSYQSVSDQYLSMPLNGPGTSDFTIEGWMKTASTATNGRLVAHGTNNGSDAFNILMKNDGTLRFDRVGGNIAFTTTSVWNDDVWHHFAVTRNGSTLALWRDGQLDTSVSNSDNFDATTFYVGYQPGGYYFNGLLDEIRYTVGSAIYTSAFTPSGPFS